MRALIQSCCSSLVSATNVYGSTAASWGPKKTRGRDGTVEQRGRPRGARARAISHGPWGDAPWGGCRTGSSSLTWRPRPAARRSSEGADAREGTPALARGAGGGAHLHLDDELHLSVLRCEHTRGAGARVRGAGVDARSNARAARIRRIREVKIRAFGLLYSVSRWPFRFCRRVVVCRCVSKAAGGEGAPARSGARTANSFLPALEAGATTVR